MNATLLAIADRVARTTGMDPRSLDASRLQWLIDARCRELKLPDAAAYIATLENTPQELEGLIESVVVQETRFFRDSAVFDNIRRALTSLAATFDGPLRLLSAPCGTGQEAYSLAALAEQTGILARVNIDAFDISTNALITARAAIYPERALTGLTQDQQKLLATHEKNHWRIHESLRRRIQFVHKNLAEPVALGDIPAYHLILCRNLFIYLHPAARKALAASLATALLPGGRLVIGSADNVEEITAAFAPLRPAASFAFTHREPARAIVPPQSKPAARPARPPKKAAAPSTTKPKPPVPKSQPHETTASLHKQALHHQHLGNLRKAERLTRQALYLTPTHLPSMELLQTLWHHQPNQRQRHALTARIARTRESA